MRRLRSPMRRLRGRGAARPWRPVQYRLRHQARKEHLWHGQELPDRVGRIAQPLVPAADRAHQERAEEAEGEADGGEAAQPPRGAARRPEERLRPDARRVAGLRHDGLQAARGDHAEAGDRRPLSGAHLPALAGEGWGGRPVVLRPAFDGEDVRRAPLRFLTNGAS